MKQNVFIFILVLFTLFFNLKNSYGEVEEEREGAANPVVVMGKGAFYGAGTGVLLGLAGSLVIDKPTWDVLKWSFVGGTFGGFLIGAIYAFSRPSAADKSALLEFHRTRLARVSLPEPTRFVLREQSVDVAFRVLSVKF